MPEEKKENINWIDEELAKDLYQKYKLAKKKYRKEILSQLKEKKSIPHEIAELEQKLEEEKEIRFLLELIRGIPERYVERGREKVLFIENFKRVFGIKELEQKLEAHNKATLPEEEWRIVNNNFMKLNLQIEELKNYKEIFRAWIRDHTDKHTELEQNCKKCFYEKASKMDLQWFENIEKEIEELKKSQSRAIITKAEDKVVWVEDFMRRLEQLEQKYKHIDECFADNTIDIRKIENEIEELKKEYHHNLKVHRKWMAENREVLLHIAKVLSEYACEEISCEMEDQIKKLEGEKEGSASHTRPYSDEHKVKPIGNQSDDSKPSQLKGFKKDWIKLTGIEKESDDEKPNIYPNEDFEYWLKLVKKELGKHNLKVVVEDDLKWLLDIADKESYEYGKLKELRKRYEQE